MNIKQVETFRAVMQARSMTHAAEQLHTSQPNVSRVIAQLQRETGLALFARVGRSLVATPEAEALLREVDRVYSGFQSIHEAAERIRTLGADGLRIAVSPALGIGLIPQALRVFRETRPNLPVVVHTADSATICKWTATGYCDFGLPAFVALPQDVNGRMLHREQAVCIVPRGHRLAGKRKVRPADLAGEAFISMPTTDQARKKIDRLFEPETRHLQLETSHAATICVMVAQGLGVSIINPLLYRALGLADVAAIAFEPAIHFECHSVHPKQRPEQALVGEFLDAVKVALKRGRAPL